MRTFLWVTAAAAIVCGSLACSGADSLAPAATPTFSPAPGIYTAPQAVTVASTTPGATIHYTVDGSTPTASSTAYGTPIAVSTSTTIKAIAVASGFNDSEVASGVYTITPPSQVATPTFTPPPGTYSSSQSVSLACATAGATIHYTTDGSTPTAASPAYASAITVSSTTTINAIAVASGSVDSSVATGTYTFVSAPKPATPTFSPEPGTFSSGTAVRISSTPGAMVHFTTDGSDPTESSPVCHSSVLLFYGVTLKAVAIAGDARSDVATGTYTVTRPHPAATPTFSPPPGTYTSPQTVTLSSASPGANIYWDTSGFPPDFYSHPYSGPITVSTTTTIQAVAMSFGTWDFSDLAIGKYTITAATPPTEPAATPIFSPPPGTFTSVQQVTLSCSTPGATIYFTRDGSEPGPGSVVYTGPIEIGYSTSIRAVALADGYAPSPTATGAYTIHLPNQVATPTFSPPPGTYGSPQSVTLSCATPGAWIFYWIVEDDPEWATTYTGPIDVSRTMTIKTYALPPRFDDPWSDTATGRYVIGGTSGL